VNFRVREFGLKISGLGFRVWGEESKSQGLGFKG
jgi:hypothetical protein